MIGDGKVGTRVRQRENSNCNENQTSWPTLNGAVGQTKPNRVVPCWAKMTCPGNLYFRHWVGAFPVQGMLMGQAAPGCGTDLEGPPAEQTVLATPCIAGKQVLCGKRTGLCICVDHKYHNSGESMRRGP